MKFKNLFWLIIERSPHAIAAFLAVFGVLSMVLLLLNSLNSALVLVLALPVSLIVGLYVLLSSKTVIVKNKREDKVVSILLIVFLLVWMGLNIRYTTQNIFIYRDPAVYTVAGQWLQNNNNLEIVTDNTYELEAVVSEAPGFDNIDNTDQDEIFALGQHLLPTFLGLSNRAVGDTRALYMGVVIGGLALYIFFGLCRFFMKSRWAMASTVLLSITLPMILFSRDMFTEPLTMLFILGGLGLVQLAIKTNDRKIWFISGLTFGAAALVRTDYFTSVIALLLFLTLALLASPKNKIISQAKDYSYLLLGLVISITVGFLDLMILSRPTYTNIRDQFLTIIFLGVSLIVFYYLIYFIRARYSKPFNKVFKLLNRYLPAITLVVCVLILAAIIARPIWHEAGLIYEAPFVAGRQVVLGNELESVDISSEMLANQLFWYLGAPIVILGTATLVYILYRKINTKDPILLVALIVFFGAAFHLTIQTITPDHIWATRRLLPVVIPGIVLFGFIAVGNLEKYIYTRAKRVSSSVKVVVFSSISLVLLYAPYSASAPFLAERVVYGQVEEINALCSTLPDNAIVFWAGNMQFEAPQATRSFCGVESYVLKEFGTSTLSNLYRQTTAKNLEPFLGLITADLVFYDQNYEDFTEVYSLEYISVEKTFREPPSTIIENNRTLLIGKISESGAITPISE